MHQTTITLGFFATSTYPDGTSVPEVAQKLNDGSRIDNIPPRPFLTSLPFYHQREWSTTLRSLIYTSLHSPHPLADLALIYDRLAETMVGDLKRAIVLWDSPPNSPRTIKRKGSSNPLIDTGHLMRSATYQLSP